MNRFPKMVALQKYRALALGYPEDKAKAIGIAEATKYAIFKNLALSKRENIEKKLIASGKVKSQEDLQELQFDEVFKIHLKNGRPFVGGKVFKDSNYNIYFSRFDKNIVDKLENWAENIIDKVPLDILKNEQKFFKEIWVKHRDDEIQ